MHGSHVILNFNSPKDEIHSIVRQANTFIPRLSSSKMSSFNRSLLLRLHCYSDTESVPPPAPAGIIILVECTKRMFTVESS